MKFDRRFLLRGALAIGASLALPRILFAARPDKAFAATDAENVMAELFGETLVASDRVSMKIPDIAENGAVVLDLDGDGYEQTGWTLLYMHMGTDGRVQSGSKLEAGARIGHPSCEGGMSNAAHLHFARRYNGEWIPADGNLPFILDGWISSGTGDDYDGYLTKGNQSVEAWDGQNPINEIKR